MRKRIVTFLSLAILCFITVGSFAETALPYAAVLSYSIDMFDTCTIKDLEELDALSGYAQEQVKSVSKDRVYHRVWLHVSIENAWWDELSYSCLITHTFDSIDLLITTESFIEETRNHSNITGYIWGWINQESDVRQIINSSQLGLALYHEEMNDCLETFPIDVSKSVEESIPSEGFSIIMERAKIYPINAFDLSDGKFSLVFRELDIVLSNAEWKNILSYPNEYYVCIYQGVKRKSMHKNVYNVLFGTPLETDNIWISRSNCHSYGYLGDADSSDCDDMTEDGDKYIEIRLLIHADSKQAAKEIIQKTPINAYFSSMCYDPSGVNISGPVQHMVSVDISGIPMFFLK